MPYINQLSRDFYDQDVEKILDTLKRHDCMSPGELNYIISRICWARFNGKQGYTRANEIVGVLECVKQEFIRRLLNPYEDEKIAENGDLKEGPCAEEA